MSLTKQDIDALVDGMCPRVDYLVEIAGSSLFSGDVRRAMYKAAGLTAEGERKPERIRCYRYYAGSGRFALGFEPEAGALGGWFVPDGAE